MFYNIQGFTCVSSVSASVKDITVTGLPRDYHDIVMVTADIDKESSSSSLVSFDLQINPLEYPEKDIVVCTTVQPLKVIYDEVSLEKG